MRHKQVNRAILTTAVVLLAAMSAGCEPSDSFPFWTNQLRKAVGQPELGGVGSGGQSLQNVKNIADYHSAIMCATGTVNEPAIASVLPTGSPQAANCTAMGVLVDKTYFNPNADDKTQESQSRALFDRWVANADKRAKLEFPYWTHQVVGDFFCEHNSRMYVTHLLLYCPTL